MVSRASHKSSPDMKVPSKNGAAKPAPKDLSHHFSAMANRTNASSITPVENALTPSVFNLGGGLPFAGNFPFDTLEGAVADPNRFPLFPASALSPPSTDEERFTVPKFSAVTPAAINPDVEIDLSTALQYQASTGYPSLAAFVEDFALNHQNQGKIPYEGPQTIITGGAQDGFSKCLTTFADIGESILVEEFMYFSAKDMLVPFDLTPVPVKLDEQGMDPRDLAQVLGSWDEHSRGKKPHMMYTVTIGQNPTGGILSLNRKKEIYKICQKHDILIFEDDPYWFMQYDMPTPSPSSTFLSALEPSYVTIDTDGRVVALQTFTKLIAPGCRTGWIVAQPAFIEKLTLLTGNTTSNPSGFAEAALSQLLRRNWGIDGFVRWIEGLMVNYKERRDLMVEVLDEERVVFVPVLDGRVKDGEDESEARSNSPHASKKRRSELHEESAAKHRKVSLYTFRKPPAGFYLWVTINLASHPILMVYPELSNAEIITRLWSHLVAEPYNILTVPGTVFAATEEIEKDVKELRITFAAVQVEQIREVGRRFSRGVKSFWMGEGWDLPKGVGQDKTGGAVVHKQIRKRKREVGGTPYTPDLVS